MIFSDTVGILQQLGQNAPAWKTTTYPPKAQPAVDELLPCPFCGCEAHWSVFDDGCITATVECMNPDCWAELRPFRGNTVEEAMRNAIAAWNRRV